MVDGEVPACLGQSPFQRIDAEFINYGGFDVLELRVRVVEDPAEGRTPDHHGRNQVDALGRRREVVQEEPEHREIPRLGDSFREQRQDFGLRQDDFLRQGETIGDVDPEVVGGKGERALLDDRSPAVVD